MTNKHKLKPVGVSFIAWAMVICLVIGCCMYFFTNEFPKDSSDHSSQIIVQNLTAEDASDRSEMVILGSGHNVVGSAVDDHGTSRYEEGARNLAYDKPNEYIKQLREKYRNPRLIEVEDWLADKNDSLVDGD